MPGTRPVRSYHHGDLKAALKKAALKLVRQKGPRGFSLNEASRLAGVSVAAPYRHFEDKDALLAEIICDGNALLGEEVRTAVNKETDLREQMLAAGMAYLHFAFAHADYFAVIFSSGIDKSKYPDVQSSARSAFGVILGLSQQFERTPELGQQRAVSAWALVHGLATLSLENALFTAAGQKEEHFRPLLERFLDHPYS